MPPSLHRWLPFLAWPRPARSTLLGDLSAGLAVSVLAVPQSLAYAQLAGVPAQHGLYAAFIPAIVGVLFGSSALLVTGPVALTSMLTAASVGLLATPGSDLFVAYVLLLALLSGLFQVGLGLARAGILLNLLSHPVLLGFINASALVIALSQLPALTGIALVPGGSTLLDAGRLLGHLLGQYDRLHGLSLGLGLLALLILLGFKRWAPRWPGVLVMVLVMIAISHGLGYAAQGGAVVGAIPAGLPGFTLPGMGWQATLSLLPAAFVIALVSFMEAMSSSKIIAGRTRTAWDENQELIGQGLAKVAAAFCGAMPVSGSFTRSALNLASHARSAWSSLIAAGLVLLVLLYFTTALYELPKPALAAMIVLAVASLVNLKAMRNAWRASRDDGIAAWLTFFATLAFAPQIQNGILAGITFSLGAFIYRRMLPRIALYGLDEGGGLREIDPARPTPGGERVVALRFDAALFFANATFFEDAVGRLERENPALRSIVVLAQGINLIDATAVEMLRELQRHLVERHIRLLIAQPQRHFVAAVERTGLIDALGRDALFDNQAQALAAALAGARSDASADPSADDQGAQPGLPRSPTASVDCPGVARCVRPGP